MIDDEELAVGVGDCERLDQELHATDEGMTKGATGGTVGGIGQALLEQTVTDGTGRIANATLADYLVPVNADAPAMDVVFVGEPDPLTEIGTKGVGEIGLPGIAAAVANAVYHATGRRIRLLPITIDRLR